MTNTDDAAVMLQVWQRDWLAALADYEKRHPGEAECVEIFRDFMMSHADAAQRERVDGHLTGAAWLVSGDGARILLTHHRKLQRWLQLGGHADGDVDLAAVALREAQEESGLPALRLVPGIFDLDRHWIPARGDVAGHWHYDVRYVVHCDGDEQFTLSEESLDLAWRDIAALAADAAADMSLRRMATKWLQRSGSG